jgi:hypothetical protein
MSGDKATGLSGIRLIFKGDAPDIEMNQFTSPKLTKNGEAYRFSFLENIRKEILPQYKGDNSPYTMFSINFYTPITEPGIYTLEFNYKGISYKTGNVEIKG